MLGEATLDMLREEGVNIIMHASPARCTRAGARSKLAARDGASGPVRLVCGRSGAWRRWRLELAKAGVALDIQGFIATDRYQASSVPGSMPSGT